MTMDALKNIVFIGEVDAGKSALLDKLSEQQIHIGKTQSAQYYAGKLVDTPGEFVDNRSWFGPLLSTICNVKTVLCLQPANATRFAPMTGLLTVYSNKNIVGVISKIDTDDADIDRAKRLMRAGQIPEPYLEVSIHQPETIDLLYRYLLALQSD
ncbi:EutP/PduV family microcompartment system protein [Ferrimonas lipolytica]|uniref:Ethanolamine utilization protein n=1 Tax=Ferrimonas lipolytica TaxID=2724191 RepID=A0A6H1UBX2_9GAMM|nr:EutP/PduV family microcompartment system protein [Ferrimonas lipolytica]QIZ75706.1 ethanolamine utilization protein [Ferrimonas lipolytica]